MLRNGFFLAVLITALSFSAPPAAAQGFSVTVDAQQLDYGSYSISGVGTLTNDSAHTLDLAAGTYQLSAPFAITGFFFDVDAAGNVQYDTGFGNFLAGAGTNTLTVQGFPVTIDISALSYMNPVSLQGVTARLDTTGPETFRLLPNSGGNAHPINAPFAITRFVFEVGLDGNVQYDPGFGNFLAGAGTNTLTVQGIPVTIDISALSYTNPVSLQGVTASLDTTGPETFRLLPNSGGNAHPINAPFAITRFVFEVGLDGNVQYDPGFGNFLAGAGTNTLTVQGIPVTIDISALSYTDPVGLQGVTASLDTTGPETFRLLPNSGGNAHPINAPFAITRFVFEVGLDGNVQYDPGFGNFLAGAGTNTLTVQGIPVTIDISALSYTDPVGLQGVTASLDTTGPETFRLLPNSGGNAHPINAPFAITRFVFEVGLDGNVQYDPGYVGFLDGAGTAALTVAGCPITIDARAADDATFSVQGAGSFDTATPVTLALVPNAGGNRHRLTVEGGPHTFFVNTDCTVDYDASEEGFLGGRGTATLRVAATFVEGAFVLTFDPEVDGVHPEAGQNTVLYDPPPVPGSVVGTLDPAAPPGSPLVAVTELFFVGTADPAYLNFDPDDVSGTPNQGQRARVFVSVAQADPADPTQPDVTTETVPTEMAVLLYEAGGARALITGRLSEVAPPGAPYPFMRVRIAFEYDNPVEAEIGPFILIDQITIPFETIEEPIAPVFEAPTDPACGSAFSWVAGKELAFTLRATDANTGDTVTLDASGLPAGATLTPPLPLAANPAQSSFSWTPGQADVGPHAITFTATDGTGRQATCTFAIEVTFDSDGDGLPDAWELDGYTRLGDGTVVIGDQGAGFVDLPAMGADQLRKDVFVQIDYMVGRQPMDTALAMVVAAFADAPVDNPDGSTGITLHINLDEQLELLEELGTLGEGGVYVWTRPDGSLVTHFDDLKAVHFPEELESTVHYCIWADKIPGQNAGMSRGIEAGDFIVSLGDWIEQAGQSEESWEAGTFMHELGHNLGLGHGGGDDVNFKPNYLSIMNYAFQMDGLMYGGELEHFDYSRTELDPLDEYALDESQGLTPAGDVAGYGTTWWWFMLWDGNPQNVQQWAADAAAPIDWRVVEYGGPEGDINQDSAYGTLTSFDDWSNLVFAGGNVGAGIPLPPPAATPSEELDLPTALTLMTPAPVTKLNGHAADGTMLHLTWKPAGPQKKIKEYRIYRDGTKIGTSVTTEFKDQNVEAGVSYIYFVTWVNVLVQESVPSEEVVLEVR